MMRHSLAARIVHPGMPSKVGVTSTNDRGALQTLSLSAAPLARFAPLWADRGRRRHGISFKWNIHTFRRGDSRSPVDHGARGRSSSGASPSTPKPQAAVRSSAAVSVSEETNGLVLVPSNREWSPRVPIPQHAANAPWQFSAMLAEEVGSGRYRDWGWRLATWRCSL